MFSEMKVSTRLALAFGLVLVLLVGVVGLGISRMARVNEGLRTITEENNIEMNHASSMRAAAFQTSISLRNMMLMTDPDKLKAEDGILHKGFHEFDTQADALEKMFQSIASTTPTEKDLLASVKKQWQAEMQQRMQQMIPKLQQMAKEAAEAAKAQAPVKKSG